MVHAPDFLMFPASRNAGAREERAYSVNTTLEVPIPNIVEVSGIHSQHSFTAKIAPLATTTSFREQTCGTCKDSFGVSSRTNL